MTKNHHNDDFSIAVDKVLLKLSKEYGFSVHKDDYVLTQLFLNKEILESMLSKEVKKLTDENDRTRQFFRDALIKMTKLHNEKSNKQDKIIKLSIIVSSIAISLSLALSLAAFLSG